MLLQDVVSDIKSIVFGLCFHIQYNTAAATVNSTYTIEHVYCVYICVYVLCEVYNNTSVSFCLSVSWSTIIGLLIFLETFGKG